jgi:hypothetical protein
MLDAERARADWREVARIVLHIDPEAEGERAAGLSTATCRARNGFRDGAISSFCAGARYADPGVNKSEAAEPLCLLRVQSHRGNYHDLLKARISVSRPRQPLQDCSEDD